MKRFYTLFALLALIALWVPRGAHAQSQPNFIQIYDYVFGAAPQPDNAIHESAGMPWGSDPVTVEGRHWPTGCEVARQTYVDTNGVLPAPGSVEESLGCGERFYYEETHNLLTSVGQDKISSQISDTAAQPASFNYIALTNSAITPAVADTSLTGEIATNGLSRAQGTFTNLSAAIGALSAATGLGTVGTTGAATLHYWPFCHTFQGYTPVSTDASLSTANATLTTSNYVTGSFTGKLGCSDYVVVRTNSSTPPSGSLAGGATQASSGSISAGYISCSLAGLTAGTAPTCNFADQSNTVTAFTVPASDATYAGSHKVVKTFTATGTQSAQAGAIFNASSGPTMLAEFTFSSASLITNDTLQITWTLYH